MDENSRCSDEDDDCDWDDLFRAELILNSWDESQELYYPFKIPIKKNESQELCEGLRFQDKKELQIALKRYSIRRNQLFTVKESTPEI